MRKEKKCFARLFEHVTHASGFFIKVFSTLIAVFLLVSNLNAQHFLTQGKSITDYQGYQFKDTVSLNVLNLPNQIDINYGLDEVCISIQHKRVSDLKIELISPDGTKIWLTNRNGGQGEDYKMTCFKNNGFNGYVHKGKAPFTGEYIPDGRMDFINNGQNPNGKWMITLEDLSKGINGSIDLASLLFKEKPSFGIYSPCNEGNSNSCLCSDGTADCMLLPDLVILPKLTENQILEYSQNDKKYPGQLRFAASIANIGTGPMEILGSGEWFCGDKKVSGRSLCSDGSHPRQNILQKTYSKISSESNLKTNFYEAGTNYYDDKAGHDHYHVDDWVEFRLIKEKWGKKKIISKGRKVSYCLFDSGICSATDSLCIVNDKVYSDKNLSNYGFGGFSSCNEITQGISVGGYDTYGYLYEGQYLNIPPKTKNGKYILEIEIDPKNQYKEINKNNNLYSQVVFLDQQRKGNRLLNWIGL